MDLQVIKHSKKARIDKPKHEHDAGFDVFATTVNIIHSKHKAIFETDRGSGSYGSTNKLNN